MLVAELENRYRLLRPAYEGYGSELARILERLTSLAGIPVAAIESRAKSVEGFLIKTRSGRYDSPLEDITDLAGVRVVTHYSDDVAKVERLIRDEFRVDDERSENKAEALPPNAIGYSDVHLIVGLDERRCSLPEFRDFKDLVAEVQIRTLLQHAWDVVSWRYFYKSQEEAPRELHVQLANLGAILRNADSQFAGLRAAREATFAERLEEMKRGDWGMSLDVDSIRQFLEKGANLPHWRQLAEGAGFETRRLTESDFDVMDCHVLWRLSRELGMNTVADLQRAMRDEEETAAETLASLRTHVHAADRMLLTAAEAPIFALIADHIDDLSDDLIAVAMFTAPGPLRGTTSRPPTGPM
jgi:ppGpp synthetase/RelA/SpoT-type nucleotidyltranferase